MTVSNMAPGDVDNVYVNLTNTGTLSSAAGMTLSDTSSSPSLLTTDASRGLTVTITACPTAWSAGSCSGTPTTILTATPVANIGSAGVALANVPALAANGGQLAHLQFSLALPNTTETSTNGVLPLQSIQGLSSTITWTFTEQQRAATVTNA